MGPLKNEAKGIEMKGKQERFDPGMKKDFLILRRANEDLGSLFAGVGALP